MEYVPNGTLASKIEKEGLNETQIWKYFWDLIYGLEYMHSVAKIIHWDIKPENLLLDKDDNLKISDFGVSTIVEKSKVEIPNTAGSNYFFSPEIAAGSKFDFELGSSSDIWACGVTLYLMIHKKYPFQNQSYPALYQQIQHSEPDYNKSISPLLLDLLKKLFIKDHLKRITLSEIKVHPWVTKES